MASRPDPYDDVRPARAYLCGLSLSHVAVSDALTDPADNVNWVYGSGSTPQTHIGSRAYLVPVMLFFPLVVYLPTHLLLRALLGGR
jgi:hypothetical protein